jgi:hypothetical protein
MIREFLEREKQFLLDEFDAPDLRTIWWRVAFYTWVWGTTIIGLFGVVAVYEYFGLPAMAGVVFLIYVLCLRLERRSSLSATDWTWLNGNQLPPPGQQALPSSSAPRLPPPGMRAIADNRSHTRR